ncbi:MAG: hypothetical protein HY646_16015 [Acidobacteria bacterium]|nr:hypothetical protein [Acidobacteriota bacterium]
MFKKHVVAGFLVVSVYNGAFQSTLWSSNSQDSVRAIEEVKERVAKRGVGEKARVAVKLHDKTEIRGYVSQAGDENFVVRDNKTGENRTIAYSDVRDIKGIRSTGVRIAIWTGVGVGVYFGLIAICLAAGCGD